MRLETEVKLDYKDVLIRPKRSTLVSRKQVDLNRTYNFRNYQSASENLVTPSGKPIHYQGIPIMASNMDGVGTFEMADTLSKLGLFTCLIKTYSVDELKEYFSQENELRKEHVAVSFGIRDEDYQNFEALYKACGSNIKFINVDIANGYLELFVQYIEKLRKNFPSIVIIAGSVVTGEMTEELILAGADIVRVGIGSGSVCTTRIKTGVGYPQLSAVIECADAAHGLDGHIIADGGCTTPADVAKGFAAAADFVMLGGMFSGHDEGGGDVITKSFLTSQLENNQQVVEEKKFIEFYGNSSQSANVKHYGGLKNYRAAEGKSVLVPYKGSIKDTVQDILGGLRSSCTYVGALNLKQLSKRTTFIRCTQTHNAVYEK